MSGPKTRCPSCGTEWDAPIAFCGECGTRFSPPAAQVEPAKAPPRPSLKATLGNIPVPSLRTPSKPAIPVKPVTDATKGTDAPKPNAGPRGIGGKGAEATPGRRARKGSVQEDAPSIELSLDNGPLVSFADAAAKPAPQGSSVAKVADPASTSATAVASALSGPTAPSTAASASAPAAPPAPSAPAVAPVQALPAAPSPSSSAPIARAASSPPAPIVTSAFGPSSPAGGPGPSFEDDTARMLEDLDAGFDSIVEPTTARAVSVRTPPIPREDRATPQPFSALGASTAPATEAARAARHHADMTEVRELFAGIAVAYARPVRDFMLEVAWGDPTREWLEVALPATEGLRRAAAAVELAAVDDALDGFQTALELALGESTLGPEVREMITGSYARLIEALPAVFALEDERGRREPMIVRSLLLQVPGVRHVALQKLYRAGVSSLDQLYAARPRELAEATGLDLSVTTAIYERFQHYRKEVAELTPTRERAKERAELAALVQELSSQHEAHERAASSWSRDAAQKRITARKEREAALVRIELFLARLGEIDLASSIAKLPFHQKIRELYRFLDEANQRSGR